MAQLEATEELLVLQHAFVNHAIDSVQEDPAFQNEFMSFLDQNNQFWQLKITRLIRSTLETHVGSCIDAAVDVAISEDLQDPAHVLSCVKARVEASHELQEAFTKLEHNMGNAVDTLWKILNYEGKFTLDSMATNLQQKIEGKKKQPKAYGYQEAKDFDSNKSSCERLGFDVDFIDTSKSAMSISYMDEISILVRKMSSGDVMERGTGFNDFMLVPIIEIIHSGPLFSTACSAVAGFFLDAKRAHRFVYDLMNQIDDAMQFLALFWVVLDFIGTHLESGELFLNREDICQSTNVIRHWVYFPTEALAQLLDSTFRLLTMYSKEKTEVGMKHINSLTMLFLIADDPVRWLKLWLLNVPNIQQLFVAMNDSGFIVDLLQYLSHVQPLIPKLSMNSSVQMVEKRSIQCVLTTVSYICEYQQGRDLLSQWQPLSARAYITRRDTSWEHATLQTVETDNDIIYRSVRMPVSSKVRMNRQAPLDELEADCKILGHDVVHAILMSIATIVVTWSKCSPKEEASQRFHDQWAKNISKSAATYLHCADRNNLLTAFAKIIDACRVDQSGKPTTPAEETEIHEWFPFTHPKSAINICQFVINWLSKRPWCANVAFALQASGEVLLQMILSNKATMNAVTQDPHSGTSKLVFQICKRYLKSRSHEAMKLRKIKNHWTREPVELLNLIADTALHPNAFNAAREAEVIGELWNTCTIHSKQKNNQKFVHLSSRIVRALWHSARALNALERVIVDTFQHTSAQELAALSDRELLDCLSNQDFAQTFFRLADVQDSASQIISEVQASVDFTVALNSPEDEGPMHLTTPMRRLQWLRCCLGSQFACSSLMSISKSPLVDVLSRTLAIHRAGFCMSSCHAEDTCCVVFQLLLSLVSSVPSMLECSSLLLQLNVMRSNAKCTLQRGVLYDTSKIISACSFLENQLCYAIQFIGGPTEKLPQHELFAFDVHICAPEPFAKDSTPEKPAQTHFESASMLQDKIFAIVHDSSPAPLNVALIAHASWECISDLETQFETEPSFVSSKSARTLTNLFANLMFGLVISKSSPLELPVISYAGKYAAGSSQNVEQFLPTDSQWKCMSNLYQDYANMLSLESSSTLLDCIVETFGIVAMDCFPITILMILHPTYEEADILKFLSHCLASPSAEFLWPRSAIHSARKAKSTTSATIIAEKVETILNCEFPQIIHAIDQCQCSLMTLVQRWHGQHFWNYLDWENIVIYTYLIILYGVEFQVYIFVAILRHLEPTMREILAKHSSQSLTPFLTLLREPIRNFRFSSWQTLLLRLQHEYHERLDPHLSLPVDHVC